MRFRFSTIVLLLLSGLFIFCSLWRLTPENLLFTDDAAFSIGLAREILSGEWVLNGLPSHLGARHLGPFYPWFIAAIHFIAGEDIYRTAVLLTVVKIIGVLLVLRLARFMAADEKNARWIQIATMCTALGGGFVWTVRVDWINNFVFLPAAAFFLAAGCTIRSGISFLPVLIAASTVLLQTHLSTAPTIAGTWIVVLCALVMCRGFAPRAAGCPPKLAIASGLLTAALWIPAVIYEFIHKSNINALFFRHVAKEEAHAGFSLALHQLYDLFEQFGTAGLTPPGLSAFQIDPFPLLALGAIPLFASYLAFAPSHIRWTLGALLSSTIFMVAAVSRLAPPVYTYYFFSLMPLALIVMPIALGEAVAILSRPHALPLARLPRTALRILSALFILTYLTTLGHGAITRFLEYTNHPFPAHTTLQHAQELAHIIDRDRGGKDTVGIVIGDPDLRANAYQVFLERHSFATMMFSGRFGELQTIQDRGGRPLEPARGYLIRCPKASPAQWEKMTRKRRLQEWQIEDELSLNGCPSCAQCQVHRLTRIAPAKPKREKKAD